MKRNGLILIALFLLFVIALLDQDGQKKISALFEGSGNSKSETSEEQKSITALAAEGALKPGTSSPAFKLSGLDGKQYAVGGKRDKALLLNFWASWCDPCREEAPELVNIAEKYKDSLDVYGVNVTFYDKLDDVKKFVKEYGFTFPVLLDEKEKVYRMYNGIAFPTNILIDKDGVIRDVVIGLISPEDLQGKIEKLLNP
ncbi:TlpA family protein disulfide reductase [Paenibacillus puldeungensis]|uniref:TlpA family protein disulfide reductase n=1 Tax=Paenibacillus puldeungensis TaxID=696536 RepID=A0ABW3RW74_9BACL